MAIYERDDSRASRDQGATLDLHQDSGLKALESAGLLAPFRRRYRAGADRMTLMNQHGVVFPDDIGSRFAGPERPEIDRGPLRDLLVELLEPGTVVWGRQFASRSGRPREYACRSQTARPRRPISWSPRTMRIPGCGRTSLKQRRLIPEYPLWKGTSAMPGPQLRKFISSPDRVILRPERRRKRLLGRWAMVVWLSIQDTGRSFNGRKHRASISQTGWTCWHGSNGSLLDGVRFGTVCF